MRTFALCSFACVLVVAYVRTNFAVRVERVWKVAPPVFLGGAAVAQTFRGIARSRVSKPPW